MSEKKPVAYLLLIGRNGHSRTPPPVMLPGMPPPQLVAQFGGGGPPSDASIDVAADERQALTALARPRDRVSMLLLLAAVLMGVWIGLLLGARGVLVPFHWSYFFSAVIGAFIAAVTRGAGRGLASWWKHRAARIEKECA